MSNELIRKSDVINILESAEYHVADDDWNDTLNSFTKEIYRGIADVLITQTTEQKTRFLVGRISQVMFLKIERFQSLCGICLA